MPSAGWGLRTFGGRAASRTKPGQPLERVEAVAVLAAVALRGDRDDSVTARPAAGQPDEARAHVFGQGGRARGIEAQLHGGRDLVDVLAAGPRRAYERNGYFVVPYLDSGRYPDHADEYPPIQCPESLPGN